MSSPSKDIMTAVSEAPELHLLTQRIALSKRRLACVAKVLPATIAKQLTSGGSESDSWCILVPNNAVAAKLRQWKPLLVQALEQEEGKPLELRLRVVNAH